MIQFRFLSAYIAFIVSVIYAAFYLILPESYYLLHTYLYISSFIYIVMSFAVSSKRNLEFILLFCVLNLILFTVFNNVVSFRYQGNFFMFSESDALFYDNLANHFKSSSFGSIIVQYFSIYQFDDFGMVILLTYLYKFFDSNIALNAFYIMLSFISLAYFYRINRFVLSKAFSVLSTVLFFSSPLLIWFVSSGLKEIVMIFLIISGTYHAISFIKYKRLADAVIGIILLTPLILFRPVVLIFLVMAYSSNWLIKSKKSYSKYILISFLGLIAIYILPIIISIFNSYTGGVAFELFLEYRRQSGNVVGGIGFSYFVNILSQMIGPFPDLSIVGKPHLAFYASSLIVKIFLGYYFWVGVYIAWKKNNKVLLILVVFVILEMLSLAAILEGLEVRKSFPHFPFFYILAVYGLSEMDDARIAKKFGKVSKYTYYGIATFLIIFWNLRGVV